MNALLHEVWVTRDGRRMHIGEMQTSHIINCINKIKRHKGRWRWHYLERLEYELGLRSVAIECNMHEPLRIGEGKMDDGITPPVGRIYNVVFCGKCPNAHVIVYDEGGAPLVQFTMSAKQARDLAVDIEAHNAHTH